MADDIIADYEKKLLKFQENNPYECIPFLAVDWLSKDNFDKYTDLMACYPYIDTLEKYKREHAHQSPEEAEIEFALLHDQWSILIDENLYYDFLDSIPDDKYCLSDKVISFMEFNDFLENTDFFIDDDYLVSYVDQLLEDKSIIIPPFLLRYLYDLFPDKKDELDNLISCYESDALISVNGLKFVKDEISSFKPMEEKILLFEIFEFTCKNMKYEGMLLEKDKS